MCIVDEPERRGSGTDLAKFIGKNIGQGIAGAVTEKLGSVITGQPAGQNLNPPPHHHHHHHHHADHHHQARSIVDHLDVDAIAERGVFRANHAATAATEHPEAIFHPRSVDDEAGNVIQRDGMKALQKRSSSEALDGQCHSAQRSVVFAGEDLHFSLITHESAARDVGPLIPDLLLRRNDSNAGLVEMDGRGLGAVVHETVSGRSCAHRLALDPSD